MNKEFFEALECLAHENSIPLEALVERDPAGHYEGSQKGISRL